MSPEEKNLLEICRKQIEKCLYWGDSAFWSNGDFEELSEKIYQKTQVKLSITTLKRIWGKVNYKASFTAATLNTLVQYIDYENWRAFRLANTSEEKLNASVSIPENANKEEPALFIQVNKKKSFYKKMAVIGLVILLSGSFLFLIQKEEKLRAETAIAKATFSVEKMTDDLPNSVVFTYDVSSFHSDSIKIQQDWDPDRQESISAKNSKHTSVYYYPGYFNAKLLVNNKIVKEEKVFIKTKGWKGLSINKPMPICCAIGVDARTLKEKLNLTVFNQREVSFYNVRDFGGLKNDNFLLEAEIQNISTVEESICRRANIQILYNGGMILSSFSDKGCISELNLWTGSESINGKENDLSAFGCDFSKPQIIICESRENTLTIFLNGKKIFSRVNQLKSQEIVGIVITFEGAGEIKKIKLGSPLKPAVYEEDFR